MRLLSSASILKYGGDMVKIKPINIKDTINPG
jgi:hypothetical protein